MQNLPWYVTPQKLQHFINEAINEDIGSGDHTSLASIPENTEGKAKIIFKDNGIVAGIELAKVIFNTFDSNLKFEFYKNDGDYCKNGDIIGRVTGKTYQLLTSERLVLNCMQRMSGIATETNDYYKLISHTKAKLLDTRKTTPNFRMLEKWAVLIGGGVNHRYGLFDMILIKDNHVDFAGGIKNAVNLSNNYLKNNCLYLKIIVEVRSILELKELLECKNIYRVLLDNMTNEMLKECVKLVNNKFLTEASGGVSKETIKEIAETGVDFISVGKLTHSVKSLDISMKAEK